jgi:hypothetical protein
MRLNYFKFMDWYNNYSVEVNRLYGKQKLETSKIVSIQKCQNAFKNKIKWEDFLLKEIQLGDPKGYFTIFDIKIMGEK